MSMCVFQKSIVALLFVAAIVSSAFCEYREGVDTTDANGYAQDSLFKIVQNKIIPVNGSKIVMYGYPYQHFFALGYFNHDFDDIQKTPDTVRTKSNTDTCMLETNCCYAIQRRTNLYAKICILEKLADGRYIYRYASNTTNQLVPLPGNNHLKPNNVFLDLTYLCPVNTMHLYWEPPLTNRTNLKGYIVYASKYNAVIDTSKPINMAQWDSVAFTTEDSIASDDKLLTNYINIIAVYNDGRSDFLKGWTKNDNLFTEAAPSVSSYTYTVNPNTLLLRKTSNGYRIDLNGLSGANLPESIIFYSLSGRQIARIDGIKNDQPLLPVPDAKVVSLFKMIFPDNHAISGRCMVARQ